MGLALVVLAVLGILGASAEEGLTKRHKLGVNIPTTYSVKVKYDMPYIGLEVRVEYEFYHLRSEPVSANKSGSSLQHVLIRNRTFNSAAT